MKKIIIAMILGLAYLTASADWQYVSDTDAMTGKPTKLAILQSNNSLDLGFPYKGTNHGNLAVRRHPKQGVGVIFMVQKGQIICPALDDCSIFVRFDDAKPASFRVNKPADHSSTIIGIADSSRFITSASKAKRILVQVVMYQAGQQVLEFQTTKPLEWNTKKKS